MPRVHINLSTETLERLQSYITNKYGAGKLALSLTVEQAVREFLEREELKDTPASDDKGR